MHLEYGKLHADLLTAPIEMSILIKSDHAHGPFVSNRDQRGISIGTSESPFEIVLSNDEALMLLDWLRDQAPALRDMVDEEAHALLEGENVHTSPAQTPTSKPSQAEGDLETVEATLREKEARG